jgi:hypothetical protein
MTICKETSICKFTSHVILEVTNFHSSEVNVFHPATQQVYRKGTWTKPKDIILHREIITWYTKFTSPKKILKLFFSNMEGLILAYFDYRTPA